MTKLYLTINNDEWLKLSQDAEVEMRHPRDHARYLLRRALGLGNDQPYQVSQTQNDVGRTRQDSLANAVL